MQVVGAITEATPGGTNEDYWLAGSSWALVLDGAGRYPGEAGGCVHPVTWVVERLAENLRKGLEDSPAQTLEAIVRGAIEETIIDHGASCNLSDPLSPGAAGAILRHTGVAIEWLVVADCAIVVETVDDETFAVIDDRVDRLSEAPVTSAEVRTYSPDFVRSVRNKPGGFWVLGAVPDAAENGLTGSIPVANVRRIMLCTDGVSRLTERYNWTWAEVFSQFHTLGPKALVDAVRDAEKHDPDPTRWRGKRHDDATVVVLSPR
ncbi:protein phosphatase 2C domain-containing protein [Actinoplanes sp. NPDC089786]|uniref:protein phosphatase 2C domain-containing protein n=1 Tax=Actinoplanes sp. NPDC089786 TaxID=3155185 RepID=UPI00342CA801